MHYSTNPEDRYSFISGLRELADFLVVHQAMPVPQHAQIYVIAEKTDKGGTRTVGEVARILGVPIQDETERGGHCTATRAFGNIELRIVSVTDQSTDDAA